MLFLCHLARFLRHGSWHDFCLQAISVPAPVNAKVCTAFSVRTFFLQLHKI